MWLVAATMAEEMGESWQGEKKMETGGMVPPPQKKKKTLASNFFFPMTWNSSLFIGGGAAEAVAVSIDQKEPYQGMVKCQTIILVYGLVDR
jgi:hypothetical protein